MIEAIRNIGEFINAKEGKEKLLENLCIKLPLEKRNNKGEYIKQRIVTLNFDEAKGKIICEIEAVKEESGKEYLWLGNNPGNKPQIFLTSKNIDYLLEDSIANIQDKVEGNLKESLKKVLNEFFISENGNCTIKPEKFIFVDEKKKFIEDKLGTVKNRFETANTKKEIDSIIKDIKNICSDIEEKFEVSPKSSSEELKNKILSKLDELDKIDIKDLLLKIYKDKRKKFIEDLLDSKSLTTDSVSIYSVKLNNDLLIKREEYRAMLFDEKIDCLFDINNKNYKKNLLKAGRCSLCDKTNIQTTSNTTNLNFKFYMTDKIGFSSNFDGKFTKNFNICKECYMDLMTGERFIENNMKTYIGGLNLYIIPTLLFKNANLDFVKLSGYIKHINNVVTNLNSFSDLDNQLNQFKEFRDEKNNFIINYLFYRKGKSDFKILRLIKDVPPSRLNTINNMELEINQLVTKSYNDIKTFKIDLNGIYYTIPISANDVAYSKFLEILDAIFSDRKIDYSFLIDQFVEIIRIIHFGRNGYNISPKINLKSSLEFKTIQLNFALLFFNKLNLLRGLKMNESKGNIAVPEEITKFWNDIGTYDDPRKALFLLGYIVGNVGNRQYLSGHKTKPILNKINFQGMNIQTIIHLTNDIFEKLTQYKILGYNETIFHQYKRLVDTYSSNWPLNNQENVFYILSGYSFSTYQAITAGKIEPPKEEERIVEGGIENE
ncbi:MAG: TIGR02556 family CRISPR-associated protein [Candidatus Methanoperedens sp.]|nr:TIGR02556 family CRISPR-associated protein [Candidatus Methanoperedens sp.]